MGFCANIGEFNGEELMSPVLVAECGTLYEGLQVSDNVWKKKYYIIFLLRRFLYVSILILLYRYPKVQYLALLLLIALPVIILMQHTIGSLICRLDPAL